MTPPQLPPPSPPHAPAPSTPPPLPPWTPPEAILGLSRGLQRPEETCSLDLQQVTQIGFLFLFTLAMLLVVLSFGRRIVIEILKRPRTRRPERSRNGPSHDLASALLTSLAGGGRHSTGHATQLMNRARAGSFSMSGDQSADNIDATVAEFKEQLEKKDEEVSRHLHTIEQLKSVVQDLENRQALRIAAMGLSTLRSARSQSGASSVGTSRSNAPSTRSNASSMRSNAQSNGDGERPMAPNTRPNAAGKRPMAPETRLNVPRRGSTQAQAAQGAASRSGMMSSRPLPRPQQRPSMESPRQTTPKGVAPLDVSQRSSQAQSSTGSLASLASPRSETARRRAGSKTSRDGSETSRRLAADPERAAAAAAERQEMLEADRALAEHSTGQTTARSRPDGSRRGSFKIQRRGSAANRAFANLRAKKSEILGAAPTPADAAPRASVGGALSNFLSAVGGTCTRRGVPDIDEGPIAEDDDDGGGGGGVGSSARYSSGSIDSEDMDAGASARHSTMSTESAASVSWRDREREACEERPQHTWSASQWIKAHRIDEILAEAVLAPIIAHEPSGVAQFTYCKGLTRDDLHRLLQGEDAPALLDMIEELLWDGVAELQETPAAGGQDLSAKFASEAAYMLEFGSVDTYYSGLEALLGPPAMDPADAMRREFCEGADADNVFTTSNGITTTSREEYEFVAHPVEGKAYPERKELIGRPELRRRPLRPDHFKEQLERKNAELVAGLHSPLIEEETVAGRLYTGPAYEKLNLVLRAQSGNAFLRMRCKELCQGNTYATTIHAVASCVLKLSKLTTATRVYRGLSGAALPASFFEPNAEGVCGGVEFGFMSTSKAKSEALAYATSEAHRGKVFCPTLLEMEQGMVSRGAEMSWLSQYPHEEEVLFSPLLGVEAQSSRIEKGVLVVQLRCTVNVTARTLEQQMSKRRRLVQEMCDNIEHELTRQLATPEWEGMAMIAEGHVDDDHLEEEDERKTVAFQEKEKGGRRRKQRPNHRPKPRQSATPGEGEGELDGHAHARSMLRTVMVEVSSKDPSYYNDDQAWGDAIASAVAASQQVAAWPEALRRLCAAVNLDGPRKLMMAKNLIVGFRNFGLAEAEVLELLLRVSSALHGLTIHDGGDRSRWPDEAAWARCVAALARGVANSHSLHQLNLRHVNLHAEAGRVMAEALRSNATLTSLRFANNGLEPANLATAVGGKRQLKTLAIDYTKLEGETLPEVVALVASSPSLTQLSLLNCNLSAEAGALLAEALKMSTAHNLLLNTLDARGNQFDSAVGFAIADALHGNFRLTQLQVASNPMGQEAFAAVKHALEQVVKAWKTSPEGRAAIEGRNKQVGRGDKAKGAIGELFGW